MLRPFVGDIFFKVADDHSVQHLLFLSFGEINLVQLGEDGEEIFQNSRILFPEGRDLFYQDLMALQNGVVY